MASTGRVGVLFIRFSGAGNCPLSFRVGSSDSAHFLSLPSYNLSSTSNRAGRDLMPKYNATLDQTCLLAGAAVEVRSKLLTLQAT